MEIVAGEECWRRIGAEGACRRSFFDRARHRFRSILADEFEQFRQLARQCAIGIGDVSQIAFEQRWGTESIEKLEQTLLRAGLAGRWTHLGHFGFEANRRRKFGRVARSVDS